jgi:hypothetical protein
MRSARELPARDYLALKSGTEALIEAAKGSRNAERHTRVGHQHLSKCASVDEEYEETFLTIDVVADVESVAGPVITRELARLCGYGLGKLPVVSPANMTLSRIGGEAMKEVSEVFSTLGRQLEDGVFDRVEGPELEHEIDEAIEKLLTLKFQARAIAEGIQR